MSGIVVSVNVSAQKGTRKTAVAWAQATRQGLSGDAHAGTWHRQITLLSRETVDSLARECGRTFAPGDFAENLTTAGIDLTQVCLRDRLRIGAVVLEVTQVGKSCHGDGCAIRREIGTCVMPTQGIFARVIEEGDIRPGAAVELIPVPLRVRIITLSDRASRGEYEDRSGPAVREALEKHFTGSRWRLAIEMRLLPDDAAALTAELRDAATGHADVIFTTGGTGIGPRDITPETVRRMLDREIPGIMEAIRVLYGRDLPAALLSRSMAGVMGTSLVYALPGSVRAVNQYMSEILKSLEHALRMLWGIDDH